MPSISRNSLIRISSPKNLCCRNSCRKSGCCCCCGAQVSRGHLGCCCGGGGGGSNYGCCRYCAHKNHVLIGEVTRTLSTVVGRAPETLDPWLGNMAAAEAFAAAAVASHLAASGMVNLGTCHSKSPWENSRYQTSRLTVAWPLAFPRRGLSTEWETFPSVSVSVCLSVSLS